MRALACALWFLVALAAAAAQAQPQADPLQGAFVEGMRALEAGDAMRAERIFRDLLERTDSARVKLELARALYQQAKYKEAKALFKQVSMQSDTPWRVRDNIAHYVRQIEDRTGYLKFGISLVSDSNPRNLTEQKEIAIGDLRLTPSETPKTVSGLRYAAQGWKPMTERFHAAAYVNLSYADFEGSEFDRGTAELGALRDLSRNGRVRGKVGIELGTYGGQRLYRFPYVGFDAVLVQNDPARIAAELKLGKVKVHDFGYLDATHLSTAVSASQPLSENAVLALSGSAERAQAKERAYSYSGGELGISLDSFWPRTTMLLGARFALGGRRYAASDPFFGVQRTDRRRRADVSIGNKRWRWRDRYISALASFERNRSSIAYYAYRKFNLSLVVE
jgi:hypothetical protein